MAVIDLDRLRSWIGRQEVVEDIVTAAPVRGMAATLDLETANCRQGTTLPALWHWLYFLPSHAASDIATDGHARKGGFLPDVPLPRRMWAGSRIEYQSHPAIGSWMRRESTISDVTQKTRGDSAMVFVTVDHVITVDNTLAMSEQQDIVYLEPAGGRASKKNLPSAEAEWSERVTPDPVLLFRYSALTFNAHRIHYDRDYATRDERYPGLVVHAPLTATLLLGMLQRQLPSRDVVHVSIRAMRPMFDTAAFYLQGRCDQDVATLWALDVDGAVAMRVTVRLLPQ